MEAKFNRNEDKRGNAYIYVGCSENRDIQNQSLQDMEWNVDVY